MDLYNRLSTYLKNRYGERVQRLPINAGFTCPNKTGEKGKGGCIYCDSTGSGFAAFSSQTSIENQVKNMISRYQSKANKFIVYFQSNTNTYAPAKVLKIRYEKALIDDRIVALDVSTRPDCISNETIEVLKEFKDNLDVFVELGVESTNPNTLKFMNRGHTLAEVIDATNRLKKANVEIILHYIIDFPTDTIEDVVEMAKISSVLRVNGVKLHSLYIVENTKLGEMYKLGEFVPLTLKDFVDRSIIFLEYLDPNVVIHRLVADPPKEGTLHGNWGLSKIQILNIIEAEMKKRNSYQGKLFDYLK
ncbi:TIGR01212 family radical SAM protein [Petrotoga sp. 9PWA.NaAc.5.4]|uniref:TIGR01212 family radical SAM protein n=1 Tax=Petrotoga sp. 9PWA.NaAc.5.4 TaxID=1434328 RepID=UPI000CB32397|nr:TIGR01212 family radical SAM protein [Petrotoga sp. 9PWA.NaAc.5.4]PNR97106.1 radical SAM protein [Petrotoga sp. 9PWA.NaAc.5.4]